MKVEQLGLIPLRNFGILDIPNRDIYRSAQPIYKYEYLWLKNNLNIKTIVNLRSESRLDSNKENIHGIEVVNIDVVDHKSPSHEAVEKFQYILSRCVEPMLFHCAHGHGRTSTFSVIAKAFFGMPVNKAIEDEESRFHYQFRHPDQIKFLKSLNNGDKSYQSIK